MTRFLFLAAALAAGTTYAAEDLVSMSAAQQQKLGITQYPVERASESFGQELPAQVVVPPARMHVVAAPQNGQVQFLAVGPGDEVRKGQVLARLQSPELLALQRDFLQALSQERLAASTFARDQGLFKEGIIAERRFLETRSRHEEMSALLDEKRQTLRLAGMDGRDVRDLERSRKLGTTLSVRSPITGVVLERQTEIGQRLDASTPIYRLASLETLWVEIRLPVERLPSARVGAQLQIVGTAMRGRLIAIGHDVDPASQTVLLRGEITQGGAATRPGQYVQASLAAPASDVQFRIPAAAVVRSGTRNVVFVEHPKGFAAREVRLLVTGNGYAVVAGNLNAGEHVAVSGIAALKGAWMGLGGSQ